LHLERNKTVNMRKLLIYLLPFGLVDWYTNRKRNLYVSKLVAKRKVKLDLYTTKDEETTDREGVYVNFGCGTNYQKGWVNIDGENNGDVNLFFTMNTVLPFENDSVDGVFSEHFVEHIDLATGTHFFKECFRVLKKGSVLRVVCPNLDYILSKMDNVKIDRLKNMFISVGDFNRMPEEISSAEIINWIFYGHGHKFIYNLDSLSKLLYNIGYSSVYPSEFGLSKVGMAIERRMDESFYSLYVEAIK